MGRHVLSRLVRLVGSHGDGGGAASWGGHVLQPRCFSAGWTGAVLPPQVAKRVTEACTDPEMLHELPADGV